MLRIVLLGLFILLGVGVLAAMELSTPRGRAVAVVQPLAEPALGISDSHGALAKGDRLDIAVASSVTPAQPAPADEPISPPEDVSTGSSEQASSSEQPRVIHRHRLDPTSKRVATATRPKPAPKALDIKRPAVSQRSKAASNAEPCRLSAFGGLRKALNTVDCQI
jgi:hypothetical protein